MIAEGINIWSGAKGLGGALTNQTLLAKQKGSIVNDYKVFYDEAEYIDAESAYQWNKVDYMTLREKQDLMVKVITAKLTQHPKLRLAIERNGGVTWLEKCSHQTGAKTERYRLWEGDGLKSPFIECLVEAYQIVLEKENQCQL